MPQFAAHLSLMYPELPLLDRFAAAARDGFRAVELHFPYAVDPREIAARLQDNGLQLVLFNAPAGGFAPADMAHAWDQGARGLAAQPGREAEFRAGVLEALRYAERLGCPRINVLCGTVPPGVERESLKALCVDNLRWAADQAGRAGCDILIEPTNLRDVPRYFLNRQDHAHELLDAAQTDHLKVLMDLYHCQLVEGDLHGKLQPRASCRPCCRCRPRPSCCVSSRRAIAPMHARSWSNRSRPNSAAAPSCSGWATAPRSA